MITVSFHYDEATRKWDPIVTGASSELEAKQCFAAVVLTCSDLDEDLLEYAKTKKLDSGIRIIPAV